ncbi:Aspartic peptidase, active site [Sesbania bispinosa]|nr:Aspartic peptidase, active site [Sesbania bispinosa]
MKQARNVEIALKKLSGGVGRSTIPFKSPHLVGQMKQVNIWPKRHGANADYGSNNDKNDGGVFGHNKSGAANFKRGTQNLTTKEWEERRHKGLCFRCAQPYSPTHKCPNPKLRVMLLGEDEMVNETGEVVVAEAEEESETEEGECSVLDCKKMWDGYNSMDDKSQPLKTLKLEGSVNGIPILILVDSGATHNFISPKVVKALGISVEKADKGLDIRLGDGSRAFTKGICSKLEVSMGKYTCTIDAWVLDMGGLDLILGVAWLRTLGDVTANWETMTMTFASRDKKVELHGYDSQRFAALHCLIGNAEIQKNRVRCGVQWEMGKVMEQEQLSVSQTNELRAMLQNFQRCFKIRKDCLHLIAMIKQSI